MEAEIKAEEVEKKKREQIDKLKVLSFIFLMIKLDDY